MPRGDQTGPLGQGPMTGRAAGICAGNGMKTYANPAFGRGRGTGFGFGRGFRNSGFGYGGFGCRNIFYSTGLPRWARSGRNMAPFAFMGQNQNPDPELEKQVLKNQAQSMEQELDLIRKRLSEIEAGEKDQ
jgi:hypothetical protein